LLNSFYAHLRKQMMQASVARSAGVLEATIETIMNVRTAWQQIDARTPETSEAPSDAVNTLPAPAPQMELERVPFSMSG
jgi:hypothetical protein